MRFSVSSIAALCLSLLALSACGSSEKRRLANMTNPGLCPNIFVLSDAARVIDFAGEPALDTVAWSGEIRDVRTRCRYADDLPITAQVEIDFAIGRGPAAQTDMTDIKYFVAVTRANRDLIAKEEFKIPVRIDQGVATASFTKEIEDIIIPRKDANIGGANFEIAVGFALTREQILYNRSGRSLKFQGL